MSSWSDNRTKESSGIPLSTRQEHLRQITLVLQRLARDEDLHDDLSLPEVQKAMKHWTGVQRLPPDEAIKLQDHRRVVYVLQRLQIFQTVWKQAGIAQIPLELFLQRATTVPPDLAVRLFGDDILGTTSFSKSVVKTAQTPSAVSSTPPPITSSTPSAAPSVGSSEGQSYKSTDFSNNTDEVATGATEEDIQNAQEITERARVAAEASYELERAKIEQMMQDAPPPESEAGMLTWLSVFVTLLAMVVFYLMNRASIDSSIPDNDRSI